jgi:uncharacterized membrane protein YhaH (DUF805 family)
MNFQDSVRICFSKYADFTGRASRPEYWWFFLFLIGVYIVAALIGDIAYWIVVIGTFLPSLAAAVRRMRDSGRNPWWVLIGLVPIVGGIVLIVLLAQESKGDALVS